MCFFCEAANLLHVVLSHPGDYPFDRLQLAVVPPGDAVRLGSPDQEARVRRLRLGAFLPEKPGLALHRLSNDRRLWLCLGFSRGRSDAEELACSACFAEP